MALNGVARICNGKASLCLDLLNMAKAKLWLQGYGKGKAGQRSAKR